MLPEKKIKKAIAEIEKFANATGYPNIDRGRRNLSAIATHIGIFDSEDMFLSWERKEKPTEYATHTIGAETFEIPLIEIPDLLQDQAALRQALDNIMEHGFADTSFPWSDMRIGYHDEIGRMTINFNFTDTPKESPVVSFAFLIMFLTGIRKVIKCPGCGGYSLKKDPRSVTCSTTCRQRVARHNKKKSKKDNQGGKA